jgi:uncharacterized protein
MALPQDLLDILACPESKKPLVYFPRGEAGDDPAGEFLFCPESRLRYRIDDGIPVMLIEEAERLDQPAADQLMATARDQGLLK